MSTSVLILGLFLVGQVSGDVPKPAADDSSEIPPRVSAAPPAGTGDADDDSEELPVPKSGTGADIPPGQVNPADDDLADDDLAPRAKSLGGAPPVAAEPADERATDGQSEPPSKTTSPAGEPARNPTETNPDAESSRKIRPADLVKQASAAPATGALTGGTTTLLEAMSRRADRPGQIEITHAYWKLFAATSAFHFAVDEQHRLRAIAPSAQAGDAALLRSAQASAEARALEAKAIAISIQHELAELMLRPSGSDLPLAVDLPHAGSYVTRFDEMFAQRTPPKRARAIHETLPLIRKALGLRTRAVTASIDAVDDSWAAYEQGTAAIDGLLSRLGQLSLQRQAFLNDVRAYNDDIADYALGSAPLGTSSRELVAMLIRTQTTPEPAVETSIEKPIETPIETSGTTKAATSRDGFVRRD